MAHKTLIDGTAYEIGGGKTLIGGTAYSIDKGKTLVAGTAYDIGFTPPLTVTVESVSLFGRDYGMNVCLYYMNGGNRVEFTEVGIYEVPAGTKMYILVEYTGDWSQFEPQPPYYYPDPPSASITIKKLNSANNVYMNLVAEEDDPSRVYEFTLEASINVSLYSGSSSGNITITETEQPRAYVTSISVTTPPTKTVYADGGKAFDKTGMIVTATYENGTTADVTNYSVLGGDAISATTPYVVISYTELGKTVVAQYKVDVVTSGVLADGEIADSWSVIKSKTNIGSYAIGSTKGVTLSTGEKVQMEIIAFGLDVTPSGSTAAITWLASGQVKSMAMNSDKTAIIDWTSCDVRSYLQGEFYNSLPADVKDAIVTVTKTYYVYESDSTLTSNDNIWIPSRREMFGGTTFTTQGNHESHGVVYSDRFYNAESRKRGTWWLRTRCDDYKTTKYFAYMQSGGGCMSSYLSNKNGVMPGFCT